MTATLSTRRANRVCRIFKSKKIFEINGRKLKLAFKPGIADGKVIHLEGKGGPGSKGAPDGDLHLRIHVLPHPLFERRDDDLHMNLDLEAQDAVAVATEQFIAAQYGQTLARAALSRGMGSVEEVLRQILGGSR